MCQRPARHAVPERRASAQSAAPARQRGTHEARPAAAQRRARVERPERRERASRRRGLKGGELLERRVPGARRWRTHQLLLEEAQLLELWKCGRQVAKGARATWPERHRRTVVLTGNTERIHIWKWERWGLVRGQRRKERRPELCCSCIRREGAPHVTARRRMLNTGHRMRSVRIRRSRLMRVGVRKRLLAQLQLHRLQELVGDGAARTAPELRVERGVRWKVLWRCGRGGGGGDGRETGRVRVEHRAARNPRAEFEHQRAQRLLLSVRICCCSCCSPAVSCESWRTRVIVFDVLVSVTHTSPSPNEREQTHRALNNVPNYGVPLLRVFVDYCAFTRALMGLIAS